MTAITVGRLRKFPANAKSSVKKVEMKGLVILAICVMYTIVLLAVASVIEAVFIFFRYIYLGNKASKDEGKPSSPEIRKKTFAKVDTNNNLNAEHSKTLKEQQIHTRDMPPTPESLPPAIEAFPPTLRTTQSKTTKNKHLTSQAKQRETSRAAHSCTSPGG